MVVIHQKLVNGHASLVSGFAADLASCTPPQFDSAARDAAAGGLFLSKGLYNFVYFAVKSIVRLATLLAQRPGQS
ncbi:MAG TPA: hypothetical protein VF518_08980, partial [Polyangia bacterium]